MAELVTSYAVGMSDEDLQDAADEMGINEIGLPELIRILIAQTWVLNDLLDGPLDGVKFYQELESGGLH